MANYFRGSTTANAVEYKCGDNIRFELELVHDGKLMSCPLFLVETWGDDGRQSRRFIPGETGKLTFDTSLEKPGFVHVLVTACALDGTPLEGVDKFEGGAGAELDKITQGRPDPEDSTISGKNNSKQSKAPPSPSSKRKKSTPATPTTPPTT